MVEDEDGLGGLADAAGELESAQLQQHRRVVQVRRLLPPREDVGIEPGRCPVVVADDTERVTVGVSQRGGALALGPGSTQLR